LKGRLVNAYALCPAFAYFKYHFPEPQTPSMELGKELDVRELVEKFVRPKCEVRYQVPLRGKLGSGRADAVVLCEGRLEVVEAKLGGGFKMQQLAQAAFYCLLAEEQFGLPCEALWLCSPEGCERRPFSYSLREHVKGLLEALERDLDVLPRGRPSRYCSYCKYSSLCPWRPP